ncbi:hypothetical protein [Mycolicibacterium sp.]|uniref:hypothetical protein n=1 Tax=Mycolicibacterium sp. TaxID=2320850 RepID=UPI0037C9532D
MLGKTLDAFLDSPLSGIGPWALMAILAGPGRYEVAVLGALAISLVVLVLSRHRGITVHVLEVFGVSYFVLLALIGLAASSGTKAWLEMWSGEITNAAMAVFAVASLVIRRPYTMAYARDVTPRERWGTPLFKHNNMVLTAVWAGAFGFSAAVGFAGDVIYGDTDNFWTGWILQLAALSFAVAFTEFYPEYARAKAVASDEHPLPSWTRVLHWIPPFVLGTGVAGWVFGAVADVACLLLVLLGGAGTAVVRYRLVRRDAVGELRANVGI